MDISMDIHIHGNPASLCCWLLLSSTAVMLEFIYYSHESRHVLSQYFITTLRSLNVYIISFLLLSISVFRYIQLPILWLLLLRDWGSIAGWLCPSPCSCSLTGIPGIARPRYLTPLYYTPQQPVAILDLQIPLTLTADELRWGGPRCITMPNFIKMSQAVAEISRFFDFSRWQSSVILDVFAAFLDHSHGIYDGLYWCAKFGCILCSSFDNMKLWIFRAFNLKKPVCAPKWRFGDLTP